MSVESARAFIKRMNSDESFRSTVENLELDEQQRFVHAKGFDFTVEDLRYVVEHPAVDLDIVIGGARDVEASAFESEFARSLREAG